MPVNGLESRDPLIQVMMPVGLQRKRIKGYRLPAGAISVTRPGRCGNPFRVGVYGTADECVSAFDLCISDNPVPAARAQLWVKHGGKLEHLQGLADGTYLADLRGHDLACYCGLDQPCHRNVLLRRANATVGFSFKLESAAIGQL